MNVAVVAVTLLTLGAAPALAQVELKAVCLCQLGSNAKQFSAEIEITDANRDALRRSIEAGDLALRKTVKVSGNGCAPAEWRKNRLCGTTSVTTTKPDGSRDSRSFENTPVAGIKTLRITNTGGIPLKRGAPTGAMEIDAERWPKVRVVLVGGREE